MFQSPRHPLDETPEFTFTQPDVNMFDDAPVEILPDGKWHCNVCDVVMSKASKSRHLKTKKHLECNKEPVVQKKEAPKIQKERPARVPVVSEKKPVEKVECPICKLVVCKTSLSRHNKSNRHIANVARQQQPQPSQPSESPSLSLVAPNRKALVNNTIERTTLMNYHFKDFERYFSLTGRHWFDDLNEEDGLKLRTEFLRKFHLAVDGTTEIDDWKIKLDKRIFNKLLEFYMNEPPRPLFTAPYKNKNRQNESMMVM